MKIKITTTNIELTSAIESYVQEKIRSVEKFALPHESEDPIAEVEIGKTTNHHQSGDVFRAEVNLRVRGKHFRATSEKDDLYAAVDDMRNELVRELSSHKDKTRTLVRRGAGMIKNMLRFGREK
ncbi:MAG: ribosomal subunit interface protein [Candidatus Yonathbacteria bacterium RIFCSPHIGHO2_01_FULL_44_41]|uniref:Ribosomal subunit interface protein n=1 Tax=Candidatus Yonathbacteria bacterium RIFCSPHIGHO2_02_FULL_44_14 TaxID=1802724 RepID=A0A1G2S9W0_9BACT|nr:MAG: ribosomal subunit interface protein [Candidatus Yonathbacteria bacterium RIFCSPHIGHO2_01_FULL_44_41]OHA81041.1 MAG: ribosomal subunit interface protein [Candidatus Yonathbacteria bacterium RIFCSPHIGHO2_02_FULL_44_14]OHA81264.1 MAG: ribosomal subunit interface protein [Candidatus Yonathbacteria bacterium RIFCSPLOWO2_01_FULL_43_20]